MDQQCCICSRFNCCVLTGVFVSCIEHTTLIIVYHISVEDGHAESPPTEFDVPVLLEHSNPKKVPSSHADSGVGKSVTRTQTKKSEFSEVCT